VERLGAAVSSDAIVNGVVGSSPWLCFDFGVGGRTVLSKFLSAFVADASITSACGFAATTAAIARGLVNGMTFGGGVEPFAVRVPAIEGINPSSRWILDRTPTSTCVRSSMPNSLKSRGTFGIDRSDPAL
jgi:hypothetical protein